MKVPDDSSARPLTTEDVKGIVLFFMDESWGEGEAVSVPAWDAWLVERDREAFDRGVAWQQNYDATMRGMWPTH